jgi:hypothetical protein
MPPDGGEGGEPEELDVSDLQPPITSVAATISNNGLINWNTDVPVWPFFIVLPSRCEVWRRTKIRRNYWV